MKLAIHLLETCRLRKVTARGRLLSDAQWWELRIQRGIQMREAMEELSRARQRFAEEDGQEFPKLP